MIREIGRSKWTIALLTLIAVILTGCAAGDANEEVNMKDANINTANEGYGIYDGEWTVNKQVVDTARLVVTDKLSIRLPENYLTSLCFQSNQKDINSVTFINGAVKPQGHPADIRFSVQGYSEVAQFSTFLPTMVNSGRETYYIPSSFNVTINDRAYRVDLLSSENGNIIYRTDTGLWTIAISVNGFIVTSLETKEQFERQLPIVTTLYFNTKKRIG